MTRAIELANGGDTVRQIAEKLGISTGTVSVYLNKNAERSASDIKTAENVDVYSVVFSSRASLIEQKSEFLNEKEVSLESR